MASENRDLLEAVEESQERLQQSIEESKRLAEISQQLLDRHRQDSDEVRA